MKITVATLDDKVFCLDISPDMEIMNFKALCEMEFGISMAEIALFCDGRPLKDDSRSLESYGIKEGEVILIQRTTGGQNQLISQMQQGDSGNRTGRGSGSRPGAAGNSLNIDFGSIQIPGTSTSSGVASRQLPSASAGADADDPAVIKEMLLASPHDIALLKERNPPLAEALLSGSLEKFTEVLKKQKAEMAERERQRIMMMNADPFDPENQKKIAEDIRLKNVESNMETAMEYSPESFGQVVMLYIDCTVNGYPVKAFVDSGAQMTIMSQACAERCHINRLVDTRWAGLAKGVGTQKIIGRVHLGQIQIGEVFLPSSFSILEDQPMDMLLGLDMLKRHQCCIDLKTNRLLIGTTSSSTPFLTESEVPDHAKLNRQHDETDLDDKALAEALAKSAEQARLRTSGPESQTGSSSSTKFPEKDIQILMSNGLTRQEAVDELTRTGGNVDAALAALIAKSIKVPKL